MNPYEIAKLADHCDSVLNLSQAHLSDEYVYQSLPLCVIDAVYSVGAKYAGTRRTVMDYCRFFKLKRIRDVKTGGLPPVAQQQSVKQFLDEIKKYNIQTVTNVIFNNRQRTSTRQGILKSQAVIMFAEVLEKYTVNYLQDVPRIIDDSGFEKEILQIPGQTKDVSLAYFFMLSGSDDFVKADRWIRDFIKDALGRPVLKEEVQSGLRKVYEILKPKYPELTLKLLDHRIWNYQRSKWRELSSDKKITKGGTRPRLKNGCYYNRLVDKEVRHEV